MEKQMVLLQPIFTGLVVFFNAKPESKNCLSYCGNSSKCEDMMVKYVKQSKQNLHHWKIFSLLFS